MAVILRKILTEDTFFNKKITTALVMGKVGSNFFFKNIFLVVILLGTKKIGSDFWYSSKSLRTPEIKYKLIINYLLTWLLLSDRTTADRVVSWPARTLLLLLLVEDRELAEWEESLPTVEYAILLMASSCRSSKKCIIFCSRSTNCWAWILAWK